MVGKNLHFCENDLFRLFNLLWSLSLNLVSVLVSNVDYSEAVGRQTKPALVITQCNCRELGGKGLVSSLNTQPCLANRPPWQNVIWKDMINLFLKKTYLLLQVGNLLFF